MMDNGQWTMPWIWHELPTGKRTNKFLQANPTEAQKMTQWPLLIDWSTASIGRT